MEKMKRGLSILLSMLMLVSFVPTVFAGNSADSSAEAKLPTVFKWSQETPGVVEFETVSGVTEYALELSKAGEGVVKTLLQQNCTETTDTVDARAVMLQYGKGEYSAKFVIKENEEVKAETSEIKYQYTYDNSLTALPKATNLTYSNGEFTWSADTANVSDWNITLYAVMGVWQKKRIISIGDGRADAQTSIKADAQRLFEEFDEFFEENEDYKDSKNYYSLYATVQATPKDITTHTFSPESDLIPIPRIAESGSVLPTEFKWSETTPGVVEFTAVPGVTEYFYSFMHTSKTEHGGGMGGGIGSMDSGNITVDKNGKGKVDFRWNILVNHEEGNHYTFNFVKTDDGTDRGNVIEYSLPLEYDYKPSATQQALPKPTGLKYENNVLSWSETNVDVLEYEIRFYVVCGDDIKKLNSGLSVTGNWIDNEYGFLDNAFDDYFEEHQELDKEQYSLYATVKA